MCQSPAGCWFASAGGRTRSRHHWRRTTAMPMDLPHRESDGPPGEQAPHVALSPPSPVSLSLQPSLPPSHQENEEQEEEEGEWEDAVMPGGPGYRLLSDEVLLLRRLEEEQSYPSHPQHNPDNYGVHFSSQSFERADSKFVERILQAWGRNTGRSRYRLMCVLRICRRS